MEEFGGQLPQDKEGLLSLPGVGPYTAGAILSIAYGKDAPVVDGNVTRLLCRLHKIRQDPGKAKVRKRLWKLARDFLPDGKAGRRRS